MSLSREDRATLLRIARAVIEACARGERCPGFDVKSPPLLQKQGAFVTIHKDGHLRGCIGTFTSEKPLYMTVMEMAEASAMKDPRFPPLGADELNSIDIEISVLSPLREVKDVSEIEVGRHGIYIIKGFNSGVLLPQVAVEYGYDRETFLDQTCLKAGLPPGAWREGARILIYEAEIIKEKE